MRLRHRSRDQREILRRSAGIVSTVRLAEAEAMAVKTSTPRSGDRQSVGFPGLEVIANKGKWQGLVPAETLVPRTGPRVGSGQPIFRLVAQLGQVGRANERTVVVTADASDARGMGWVEPWELARTVAVAWRAHSGR